MTGVVGAAGARRAGDEAAATTMRTRLRAFFRNRPDREHEIVLNRLVMCAVGLAYLWHDRHTDPSSWALQVRWLDVYIVLYSVGIATWFFLQPGISVARRLAGAVGDIVVISLSMHFGDETIACLYPLLLWTIFGNGFRYGVAYLFFATALAIMAFVAVMMTTPFWAINVSLSIGGAFGLVILPLYTSILIRQLSKATRLAEEANRAKTMFLASVSHELRTPLNAIIGLSDILSTTELDDEQVDMSRVIGRSGRSLLSLINSILDISRMECGYPSAKVENTDLHAFLSDLRDMLDVQARAKDLTLGLYIDVDTPQMVAINARHLEEIVVNLAGNAIKFTERGSVLISARATARENGLQGLRLEVADTGIGIAPEATGRIFDRFAQADETIIDRFGGTGLGLAIVKQLVEGMGGTISVQSEVGVGSVFAIDLPCIAAAASQTQGRIDSVLLLSSDPQAQDLAAKTGVPVERFADLDAFVTAAAAHQAANNGRVALVVDGRREMSFAQAAARMAMERSKGGHPPIVAIVDTAYDPSQSPNHGLFCTSVAAPLAPERFARAFAIAALRWRKHKSSAPTPVSATLVPLRILVAEDNRTNQLVIGKILERAGHAATIVSDGQQALEKLNEGGFDLALMDLNMPVLNGVDAARLYQFAQPDAARTPIAALTADATPDAERRCLDAGMIACITKPIEASELAAWLDRFAHERQAEKAKAESPATPAVPADPPAEPGDAQPEAAPIDSEALVNLKSLGGDEFVTEIVDQFLTDAAAVLHNLHLAVAEGDVCKFRDEAHALRSCAANVGALRVYKLCLDSRAIDAREFAIEGELRIRRLEVEFERARDALACFVRSEGAC